MAQELHLFALSRSRPVHACGQQRSINMNVPVVVGDAEGTSEAQLCKRQRDRIDAGAPSRFCLQGRRRYRDRVQRLISRCCATWLSPRTESGTRSILTRKLEAQTLAPTAGRRRPDYRIVQREPPHEVVMVIKIGPSFDGIGSCSSTTWHLHFAGKSARAT